jgi:hypothetical protein
MTEKRTGWETNDKCISKFSKKTEERELILEPMIRWNNIKMCVNKITCKKINGMLSALNRMKREIKLQSRYIS